MTREAKKKLLINTLDFDEVTYIKYNVYEGSDILDTYATEKEAEKYLSDLEYDLEYDWHNYRIEPVSYTISKEELINIILNTLT